MVDEYRREPFRGVELEAVEIVADGVYHITQGGDSSADLNEYFDVDGPDDVTDDMRGAATLADEIAEAIRANPNAVLALVGREVKEENA